MRRTNAEAARVLPGARRHACTDVTGFGLAGHLLEMLAASGVGAALWWEGILALDGARELAARGVASTLAPANGRVMRRAGLVGPDGFLALLADPQTSGGLLAGIPAVQADGCVEALVGAGLRAAVIGEVTASKPGTPPLVGRDRR